MSNVKTRPFHFAGTTIDQALALNKNEHFVKPNERSFDSSWAKLCGRIVSGARRQNRHRAKHPGHRKPHSAIRIPRSAFRARNCCLL